MTTLTFQGEALCAVAGAARAGREPLMLVKDEGIYLAIRVAGGERPLVCYAVGFDPTKDDRMAVYDRARAAVGGDDFVEDVELGAATLDALAKPGSRLKVEVTEDALSFGAYPGRG